MVTSWLWMWCTQRFNRGHNNCQSSDLEICSHSEVGVDPRCSLPTLSGGPAGAIDKKNNFFIHSLQFDDISAIAQQWWKLLSFGEMTMSNSLSQIRCRCTFRQPTLEVKRPGCIDASISLGNVTIQREKPLHPTQHTLSILTSLTSSWCHAPYVVAGKDQLSVPCRARN